jgi:PAS domain-containing protein
MRNSLPFATLLGSMLLCILELHGLGQTEPHVASYAYVAIWVATTFLNGAFGLPLLVGSVFVTWVSLSLISRFDPDQIGAPAIVMMAGTIITAIIAYIFWKERFVSVEQQKVSQLSGMLRSNQHQSEILIQSIADGIIMFNTEGKITLMNPAAAKMTGWALNDATGVDVQLVAKIQKEDGSDVPPQENPFELL